jgi:hypothetical protein
MLHVKIKDDPEVKIIPAGHDTRLSDNGQKVEVLDVEGKVVAGVDFEPGTIAAVVRK